MAAHEETCEFRPVKCKHCGAEQPFIFLSEHENHCPEMYVPCPNNCDKALRIKLGDLQTHLLTCPAAKPTCDICSLCQTTLGSPQSSGKIESKNHLESDHETKLLLLKHNILEGEQSLKDTMLKELEDLINELEKLDGEIAIREEKVMWLEERLTVPPEIRPSRAPSKLVDVTLLRSKTQNELIRTFMECAQEQLQLKNERIAELKAQLVEAESKEQTN